MGRLRTWLQRFCLIVTGIAIALVGAEIGLRFAGSYFLARQSNRQRSSDGTHACVVLCLGESTTAETYNGDSYPRQLQRILSERGGDKTFKVVNLGVPGTTTGKIVSQIDAALAEYQPDIVVTMMGINDCAYWDRNPVSPLAAWFQDLRVVKLMRIPFTRAARFCLLSSDASDRKDDDSDVHDPEFFLPPLESRDGNAFRADPTFSESDRIYEKAKRDLSEGRTHAAIEGFEVAIQERPFHAKLYVRLASVYWKSGQVTNAITLLKKGITRMPEETLLIRSLAQYEEIAAADLSGRLDVFNPAVSEDTAFKYAAVTAQHSSVEDVLSKALKELEAFELGDPWPVVALIASASEASGNQIPAEIVHRIMRVAQHHLDADGRQRVVGALAAICCSHGDHSLAETCWAHARELQQKQVAPVTRANYQALQAAVLKFGAVHVAMQYPMLDVVGLEQMVMPSEKTIILDNTINFRSAVRRDGLRTYFTDMFGGGFGHCTQKGNRLLAENVAETILRIASHE